MQRFFIKRIILFRCSNTLQKSLFCIRTIWIFYLHLLLTNYSNFLFNYLLLFNWLCLLNRFYLIHRKLSCLVCPVCPIILLYFCLQKRYFIFQFEINSINGYLFLTHHLSLWKTELLIRPKFLYYF